MGRLDGRLDGKVALITGAARGQGQVEAERFVAEGAHVLLADVLDDEGQRVAQSLGAAAAYAHLDVTRAADWADAVAVAVERFGGLDVLVNNAGADILTGDAVNWSFEWKWTELVAVDVTATMLLSRAIGAKMKT